MFQKKNRELNVESYFFVFLQVDILKRKEDFVLNIKGYRKKKKENVRLGTVTTKRTIKIIIEI